MKTLTILVPVLNEEVNLPLLRERLDKVLHGLRDRIVPEVIILDNCSVDRTPEIAKSICAANPNWKYVRYSRNFGYPGSLACGFDLATGDGLVVLASDLQEPPELIPKMVDLWEQGNDVVYGIIEKRNDSNLLKTLGAKIFYQLIYFFSESRHPRHSSDLRLISRKVIDVVKSMREQARYLRGLVHWSGFKQASFPYDRDKRVHGKSTAGLWYSTKWGVNAIICFSAIPLRVAAYFGMLVMLGAVAAAAYFVWARFYPPSWTPVPPTGTTAVIVLLLFAIGLNAFFMGVLGEYIGRIYDQSKLRPLYIIDEAMNIEVRNPIGSPLPPQAPNSN